MHSPFPGMDPYLEAPNIWPDVHTRLITIIGEQLTPLLAPKYLAELETQVVIERLGDDPQGVLPDVSITGPAVSVEAPSAVAVAAPAPVQVHTHEAKHAQRLRLPRMHGVAPGSHGGLVRLYVFFSRP